MVIKKMNNKKIILGATALILGTMIIISGTQVSSLKISKSAYELKPEIQHNKNMIFFGFGHISPMTIDGEYDLKGVINGNISIKNKCSNTWLPYFLLIKDTVMNKIKTKWSLPGEFLLKNFSGIGLINYNWIPRDGPKWTEFFLIGSFENIIYN
jgi:hypothetical protein